MEEFEGTVRMAGDAVALPAVLLVADDRLRVSTRRHEIGHWRLSDVSARVLEDACHVSVEGEELVVVVADPLRFAEAIGPRLSNPGDGSLRRHADRAGAAPVGGLLTQASKLARRLPGTGWALAASTAAGISLALWAPAILVGLVVLGALAGLLIGGFALLDPFVAVRLPDPATPALLIRAGTLALGVGLSLAILI